MKTIVFLLMGVLTGYIGQAQTEISFSLPDAVIIHTKGQSSKLSIEVSIVSKEEYHRNQLFKPKDGYYFKGTLRKVYQLNSGKNIDKFPIAGFWFHDELEFGKKDTYEKLRSDYQSLSFLRLSGIYFNGTRVSGQSQFKGTFYGNGLPEEAWVEYSEIHPPQKDKEKLYIRLDDFLMFGYMDFCFVSADFENSFRNIGRRTMTDAEMLFSDFRNGGQSRLSDPSHPYYVKDNNSLQELEIHTFLIQQIDKYYYEYWHEGIIPPHELRASILKCQIDLLEHDEDMEIINSKFLNRIHRSLHFFCPEGSVIDLQMSKGNYSDELLALAILRGRIAYKNFILSKKLRQMRTEMISGPTSKVDQIETNYICLMHEINYQIDVLLRYHDNNQFEIDNEELSAISSQEFTRIAENKCVGAFSTYNNLYTLEIFLNIFTDLGSSDDTGLPTTIHQSQATLLGELITFSPVIARVLLFDLPRSKKIAARATEVLKQIGEVNSIPFHKNPNVYRLDRRR